jgi:hypothetical protein
MCEHPTEQIEAVEALLLTFNVPADGFAHAAARALRLGARIGNYATAALHVGSKYGPIPIDYCPRCGAPMNRITRHRAAYRWCSSAACALHIEVS